LQNRDATTRTFAITLILLIIQLLSCGRTTPNREAIQHIMERHPATHLLQERTYPVPAEPIAGRIDGPMPVAPEGSRQKWGEPERISDLT